MKQPETVYSGAGKLILQSEGRRRLYKLEADIKAKIYEAVVVPDIEDNDIDWLTSQILVLFGKAISPIFEEAK